jgi:uncharacterized protein YdeI (YjbR/CyaY-like superfamily)
MRRTLTSLPQGGLCIVVDDKTLKKLTAGGNKRICCSINGAAEFHAAIIKSQELGFYIYVGAKHIKTLRLKAGMQAEVKMRIDDSEFQFAMPEELKEVLDTDPPAQKIFQSLTAGNQRSLIQLVLMMKSSDKRIERSLLIARKIKAGITAARLIMQK